MKNRRVSLLLSTLLILAIAGSVGVLFYTHGYINKIGQSISELKSQDEAGARQLKDLTLAEQQLKKYQDFSSVASQVLPKTYNQTEINLIVKLAAQSGISLSSIGINGSGAVSSTSGLCKPPLTAYTEVKGVCSISFRIEPTDAITFDQFMNFLNRLEQNRRKILITNLSLTPVGDKSTKLNISAELNLFTRP